MFTSYIIVVADIIGLIAGAGGITGVDKVFLINNISQCVSAGLPFVQLNTAEVVVIPLTEIKVGLGQVGNVVKDCRTDQNESVGVQFTRT